MKCDQQDHTEDEGQHDEPGVRMNEAFDRGVEEADAADEGCHQELNRQESIHFSQKSHPKTWSRMFFALNMKVH